MAICGSEWRCSGMTAVRERRRMGPESTRARGRPRPRPEHRAPDGVGRRSAFVMPDRPGRDGWATVRRLTGPRGDTGPGPAGWTRRRRPPGAATGKLPAVSDHTLFAPSVPQFVPRAGPSRLPAVDHVRLSAIVPVIALNDYGRRCLEALLAHDGVEVILIPDDVPGDLDPRVRCVPSGPANTSVKRQLGLEAARGEYVALIDDDAFPAAGWPQAAIDVLDDPTIGAVAGPTLTPPDEPFAGQRAGRGHRPGRRARRPPRAAARRGGARRPARTRSRACPPGRCARPRPRGYGSSRCARPSRARRAGRRARSGPCRSRRGPAWRS